MPLGFFHVIGDFTAIVRRSSLEPNADPFQQGVSGLATFTPSVKEARSAADSKTYLLRPILGRIVDGVLMTVNKVVLDPEVPEELPGAHPDHRRYGIRLVANTETLDLEALDYRVAFTRMVWDKAERVLNPFTFRAPDEADGVVDLASVVRTDRRIKT